VRAGSPAHPRRWLLALIGVTAAIAALLGALSMAGVFSGDEDETRRPTRSPGAADQESGTGEGDGREHAPKPGIETIEVGGRPTALAAGEGAVWVADTFSEQASRLEPGSSGDPSLTRFALEGAAADVAAGEGGVWYALPEQGAVEWRSPAAPGSDGEQIPVDGFPSGVVAGEGAVWALSEDILARIDPDSRQVTDEIALGGFGSGLAIGAGAVWVIVDNRELVRVDPATGEPDAERIEVPDAFNVAVGDSSAWVVSASGAVTGIDLDSLGVIGEPGRVRGAIDVALDERAVWVTSSARTVTRIDPATGQVVGDPVRVGDEPGSVSVGEGAVWVANGGDGTVTRIEP
jgi:hypothetical protein